MFHIRRISDGVRPRDREAIGQVQEILRNHFSMIPDKEIESLPELLKNPLKMKLRYLLSVCENFEGRVSGFALGAYAPDLNFYYLDYIAAGKKITGRGIGGALYQRVRQEAKALKAIGVFMECLPDDPALCSNQEMLKQNIARLRFYESFGATPIINTAYETPINPENDCPPYLVFDGLDRSGPLSRRNARKTVRAILTRKYGEVVGDEYIDMVVSSFKDDPVRLRPLRKKSAPKAFSPAGPTFRRIALVVNERHAIHHVHERGYVESPVRIQSIVRELEKTGVFDPLPPRQFSNKALLKVHDPGLVNYLRRVCARVEPNHSIYPYVFPIRNAARPPKELPVRAGYFCIDTFTPLNQNAYQAARRAVECSLTAAESLFSGYDLAYALVRPPGHHAERKVFGGFCYFNSAAVAADHLSRFGRVAVLDVDYHHGNGTQDIFYERDDVLTVSIHGHPSFAYPYFSGFKEEKGEGAGFGYNLNYPLREEVDGPYYVKTLKAALTKIKAFKPMFLVVALGLDVARGDPTGTWSLTAKDIEINGRLIGETGLPILVVQEGGYRTRTLGKNARCFFTGLLDGRNSAEKNYCAVPELH